MNNLKQMACHRSHASRIKTARAFFTETFFSLPSEISHLLVTRVMRWENISNCENINKKLVILSVTFYLKLYCRTEEELKILLTKFRTRKTSDAH